MLLKYLYVLNIIVPVLTPPSVNFSRHRGALNSVIPKYKYENTAFVCIAQID